MLRKLLLLIFASAAIFQASAKDGKHNVSSDLGISFGIRSNKISAEGVPEGFSLKSKLTYEVGLNAAISFGRVLAIQPELNYGYTALDVTSPDSGLASPTRVKAHDIEVPVLLSVDIVGIFRRDAGCSLNIEAGPVFNIMSKANYDSGDERVMFGGLHPSTGYAAGISTCLFNRLLVGVRYAGYFKKSVNQFEGIDFNIKTGSVGIQIGILF